MVWNFNPARFVSMYRWKSTEHMVRCANVHSHQSICFLMCSYAFVFHVCKRTTKQPLTSITNGWYCICQLGTGALQLETREDLFQFSAGHFSLWFVPHISEIKTSQKELRLRVPFVPAYHLDAIIFHNSSILTGSVSSVSKLPAGTMIWFGNSLITTCSGCFGTSGLSTHSSSTTTARCDPSWAVMRCMDSMRWQKLTFLRCHWRLCFWYCLFILYARIAHQGLWQLQSRSYHFHWFIPGWTNFMKRAPFPRVDFWIPRSLGLIITLFSFNNT